MTIQRFLAIPLIVSANPAVAAEPLHVLTLTRSGANVQLSRPTSALGFHSSARQ